MTERTYVVASGDQSFVAFEDCEDLVYGLIENRTGIKRPEATAMLSTGTILTGFDFVVYRKDLVDAMRRTP